MPLPDGMIDQLLQRNVCSRCYGDLQKREAPDRLWEAYCPNCKDAWGGTTISRYTAEKRGQRGLVELREVKTNLKDLFPNENAGKSNTQILSELGY